MGSLTCNLLTDWIQWNSEVTYYASNTPEVGPVLKPGLAESTQGRIFLKGMKRPAHRPKSDRQLIQIVDASLATNAVLCGDFLVCKPGCCRCCVGVFEISQLDAVRLGEGLVELEKTDPERAKAVRRRAAESRERLLGDFPGNANTGILNGTEKSFEDFANDEPCPALDAKTGMCDLYAHRPMTCRVFGPPVRSAAGLGICELCFVGASDEDIARCELEADPTDMESKVTQEVERNFGRRGRTIVAWAIE
jgi:Fe-S-cluster containining protein